MISNGFVILLCLLLGKTHANGYCFAKLHGPVGDIDADISKVNELNNLHILPRLRSLLNKDFFHFYQVNLERGCPFFDNEQLCGSKDCRVNDCAAEEVPPGLRDELSDFHARNKYFKKHNKGDASDDLDCDLGQLDSSLSEERQVILENWTRYDTDLLTFCEPDDDRTGKLIYVDLLKNPERYTGYKGASAHRIWFMVYNENCFNEDDATYGNSYLGSGIFSCLEKRAFYRMISGLHSSISIHLSYRYPRNSTGSIKPDAGKIQANVEMLYPSGCGLKINSDPRDNDPGWGPNVEEFRRRFDPSKMPEGPARLRNLYFTYLVELRALAKAAPYLMRQKYYTGDKQVDLETQLAVEDLLNIIKTQGNFFDEGLLFAVDNPETTILKQQFREHFHNISRIMDCVACDKCRLWGKLQTQGMGTALKILFSKATPDTSPVFHLTRTEIVALFNAFGRLSTSIGALVDFCNLMDRHN